MIRRYQHVSITVSNLDRSIAWYRDMMGFEPQGQASEAAGEATSRALGLENVRLRLATLVRGDCLLELIQYLSPLGVKTAPRPCDVGCMHMALEVDDIRTMYRDLSAKGVKFNSAPNRNPPEIAWAWWVYLQDLDGVPIELVQIEA
jgi:catechol 2,3-dioxygenase-like lactoylglutathione lyase family enzyme